MVIKVTNVNRSSSPMRRACCGGGGVCRRGRAARFPDWTGDLAGSAGAYYAKLLRDGYNGEMPSAAYWRPVTIAEDTRLAALATDVTQYAFSLPSGAAARVQVRLWFRRAFQELADLKGWDDPDILMEEAIIQVEASR
jgi:hypothetical protein